MKDRSAEIAEFLVQEVAFADGLRAHTYRALKYPVILGGVNVILITIGMGWDMRNRRRLETRRTEPGPASDAVKRATNGTISRALVRLHGFHPTGSRPLARVASRAGGSHPQRHSER